MEGMILNDVMVDLETLGRRAGCVIVSVGAVKFDPKTGFVDTDNAFYKAITVESAMRYGLRVDPDTLRWWMRHPVAFDRLTKAQLTGQAVAPAAAMSLSRSPEKTTKEVFGFPAGWPAGVDAAS